MKISLPFVGIAAAAFVGIPVALAASTGHLNPAAPKAKAAKSMKTPLPTASRRADGLIPTEYLPTSQVHAGMKGYGLSVFRGNKIEKFDVTVLGLLRKSNNGRDLILVKLSGPALSRVSDIIAGMSGSPVYVNGRLLGAVSMGFQFTKEPIGMITPIEDMLDAWDPAIPQSPFYDNQPSKTPAAAPATTRLETPLTISGRRYTRVAFGAADPTVTVPHAADTLVARPCLSRMSVTGVSARHFPAVAAALRKLGIDARDGVGMAMNPDLVPSPLTPGGAVAMSLMTGDLDMTAIGTLTYRRGNRIVAFGHPFLNIGPVDAPMFSAYIHDLLPSYSESEKLGSPVRMVGAFSQDRPFSVGGKIGAPPALVPVTVRITDHALGRDRLFRAAVLRHPALTPVLAPTAASTAIDNVHAFPGDTMATVETEVVADEVGTIRHTNRVYDASAISDAATGDLQTLVALLSSNPFYPVAIRSVTMHVTIDRGRQTAQVERVFLKQTRFEPGDTVEVGVVLKPYKQERVYRTLKVKIPPATPPGVLPLVVQGGPGSGGAVRFGGITLLPPGGGADYALATTVSQIAHKFEDRERNDDLIGRLALPTAAVSVGGERLSALPPNLDAAMRSSGRTSGALLDRDEVKVRQHTDFVLSGAQTVAIRVVRPGTPPDGTPAATPASGTAGSVGGATGGVSSGTGGVGGGIVASPPVGVGVEFLPGVPNPPAPFPTARPSLQGRGSLKLGASSSEGRAVELQAPPSLEGGTTGREGGRGDRDLPAPLVGRQPGVWHQATAADFRQGSMDGVTVTSAGDVRVAPRLTSVAQTNAPYFWSLVQGTDGTVYAGSGDDGAVYKIGVDGKPTVWAKTGELEVLSLLRASDGTLYAGTAPHGRIYHIGADGKATLAFDTKDRYVLAMAASPDGATIYVATGGDTGHVYALPANSGASSTSLPTPIYSGPEGSVTTLAVAADGSVYAGTAPNGLALKVAGPGVAPGHPIVLFDSKEASISGLAFGADGALYAATAPHGTVLRIDPAGVAPAKVIYDRLPNGGGTLTGLIAGPDGLLYTASGSAVIALDPMSGTTRTFNPANADIQILSLLKGTNNDLLVGTGNTAGIYRLGGENKIASGTFTSSILDTQTTTRWGTIRWAGDTSFVTAAAPAAVTFETRSGSTPEPDATWSLWSRDYADPSGETIVSPPARFLQYRATLKGAAATLNSVDVFYLSPNQPPQVTLLAPKSGDIVRGTMTIRWSGTDPDRDTLAYSLAISADGGKTWKSLTEPGTVVARAAAPTTAASTIPAPTATVTATVPTTGSGAASNAAGDLAAQLAQHPEISAEMRARILADAPPATAPGTATVTMAAPAAAPAASTAPTGVRGSEWSLDTAAYPDGVYRVRVAATDRPSNPTGALTSEKVSPAFRIANHAPSLVLFRATYVVAPDGSRRLEGFAFHPSVAIRGVQFRVDGGEWMAAAANDGIFDSSGEGFRLTTLPLAAGIVHTLEVQAIDEAGNAVTVKREIR